MAQGSQAEWVVSAASPADLKAHKSEDVEFQPMSVRDFVKEYSGTPFDWNSLKAEFEKVCIDVHPPTGLTPDELANTKAYSLAFASEVLFKIGPAARKVTKSTNDKTWRLKFEAGYVFISTYKNTSPPQSQPVFTGHVLMLTMKQAGLLASNVLTKWAPTIVEQVGTIVLTPLAGAIFSRDEAVGMALAMFPEDAVKKGKDSMIVPTNLGLTKTMNVLNTSCQPGGFHMGGSSMPVGVLATLIAVDKCPERLKVDIFTKAVKQYSRSPGKKWDQDLFERLCCFANRGLPKSLTIDTLTKTIETEKAKCALEQSRKDALRATSSAIQIPSGSGSASQGKNF
ncbi:MAG: nucleoprotein [Drosophila North Esk phasmavirus]|nr:MAG: nucleoprotein [Drosophila North Esk phasmavirus]